MVLKALIVDDHPLIALATERILNDMEGIEVIGVVRSGVRCLEQVELHLPDIVFLDYHLPDEMGSTIAKQIKHLSPQSHIVIFTETDVSEFFNDIMCIGVSGIISKRSNEVTIKNVINCIRDNHTIVPLHLYQQLRINVDQSAELTDYEIDIMKLLVQGVTYEKIAEHIHVSKRTVDNYLKKIYKKLGVKNRLQAIEKYIKSKYYTESEDSE